MCGSHQRAGGPLHFVLTTSTPKARSLYALDDHYVVWSTVVAGRPSSASTTSIPGTASDLNVGTYGGSFHVNAGRLLYFENGAACIRDLSTGATTYPSGMSSAGAPTPISMAIGSSSTTATPSEPSTSAAGTSHSLPPARRHGPTALSRDSAWCGLSGAASPGTSRATPGHRHPLRGEHGRQR